MTERGNELVELLTQHDHSYYVLDDPRITDPEYDDLKRELDALDPDNPYLGSVGADVSSTDFVKQAHRSPMLSLRNAFTPEEVLVWAARWPGATFVISPKMDGLALSLIYEKGTGEMLHAVTRGDGTMGELVTGNARVVDDIPNLALYPSPVDHEVRGEVHMKKAVFERLKAAGEFKNIRAAAAGGMRRKEPEESARAQLSFVAYDYIRADGTPMDETTKRAFAREHGHKYVALIRTTAEHITDHIEAFTARREQYPYAIDGLVFSLEDAELLSRAGSDDKAPRGKIAYKFPAEQKKTRVVDIDIQVGRTGRQTPMARLETVELGGSQVENATLHNLRHIRANLVGIGPGAVVLVEKRGDIIPGIARVVTPASTPWMPSDTCPSCQSPVDISADVVHAECRALGCPAQQSRKVEHFVERMGMKGIGSGILDRLRDENMVRSVQDLFRILEYPVRVKEIFGDVQGQNILDIIQSKRQVQMAVFLSALGIPSLGRTVSGLLSKAYSLRELRYTQVRELAKIPGIGTLTARNIENGLQEMRQTIDDLLRYHVEVIDMENQAAPTEQPEENANNRLRAQVICCTGKMSVTRGQMEAFIMQHGGHPRDRVARDLDILVAADPHSGSSKLRKARGWGIEVISEEELRHRAGA